MACQLEKIANKKMKEGFMCPFEGIELPDMFRIPEIISDVGFPALLQDYNPELSRISAIKRQWEIKEAVQNLIGLVYSSPEALAGYYRTIAEHPNSGVVLLCQQVAYFYDGQVTSLALKREGDGYFSWPKGSSKTHKRGGRIPLNPGAPLE